MPESTLTNGPSTDAQGHPVVDPTANVRELVTAAIERQDDLRELTADHLKEIVALRAGYDEKLRAAETARIDAIRAVDVGNVQRAAEVQAQQAQTLATQVATSAETLRAQVQATATAGTIALAAALEPIVKDIADLRRVQYEGVGQKTNVIETQAKGASAGLWVGIAVAALALIAASVLAAVTLSRTTATQTPAVVTVTVPASTTP